MDIHVDIRGFLEIHAWICYGFSDHGKAGLDWMPSHNGAKHWGRGQLSPSPCYAGGKID